MVDRAATSKSAFRTGCRGHTAVSVATGRIAIGTPSRRSRPLSVVSDLTRLPVSGPRFARRRREGSRCYKFRRLEVEDAVDDLGNLAHAANGVQGAELRTGFARRRLVTDKLRLERRGRRGACSCGRVKLPALRGVPQLRVGDRPVVAAVAIGTANPDRERADPVRVRPIDVDPGLDGSVAVRTAKRQLSHAHTRRCSRSLTPRGHSGSLFQADRLTTAALFKFLIRTSDAAIRPASDRTRGRYRWHA